MPVVYHAILVINVLGLLTLDFLSGERVSLSMRAPGEVGAGEEFQVAITLRKGELDGFARFQQELPQGLTAQALESPNALFSFENQRVTFMWLNLPPEPEVTISYRIRVHERLKGTFDMQGLFSYIEGNERRTANVQVSGIAIRPSPTLDPNLIVDIGEFQRVIPFQPPVSLLASQVRCVRQTPLSIDPDDGFLVNLLVDRGQAERFAKIEEVLPSGLRAEGVTTRDGIFTFRDGVAKFLWMNLPPEPRFLVSYRIVPEPGFIPTDIPISGTFSFIINGATQVIDIVQRNVDLTSPDPRVIDGILASIPAPISTSPVARVAGTTSFTATDAAGGRELVVQYRAIADRPRAARRAPQLQTAYLLEPEQGVYYRVQIAAGHTPVDIRRYFRRLNITEEVRTERHEGWYKYSIGSFPSYRQARDHRVRIWETTPIDDAFVTAYNNGVRITVQEALMITNQQWYR